MSRRVLSNPVEQKIYDGFVDHARDVGDDTLFEPGKGDGRGFSPFAYVIDQVFRKTLRQGPVPEEQLTELFHPNPLFKRPAYYAAVDLLSGAAVRGTTDLVDRWRAGGHCSLVGHQVSRPAITRNGAYPKHVAYAYEDVIYYDWGALPGHRFPDSAIAFQGKEWGRVTAALSAARHFDQGSYLYRKRSFASLERIIRSDLPPSTSLYRLYRAHGQIGLLKRFFGSRWEACVLDPDMSLMGEVSHCFVKAEGANFLLCSMDDAIHHKLLNKRDCTIHDLTAPVTLDGDE